MPIEEELLNKLKLDDFTPAKIVDNLKLVPEIFDFLKLKENLLGRSKGLVTYITAITIWAFRKKYKNMLRKIPESFLEKLWESFKDTNKKDIFDVPYKIEPNMWKYFLSLIYLEAKRDNWDKMELLIAATVYAPILLGCCWIFYPEEDLLKVEEVWKEKN